MNEGTLKKALTGDKKAFSQVYNQYFDSIWAYVYSRLRDKDVTSDILSESFIALYENVKNIKHHKAIKSYLYRIVKNKMIVYYKRERTVSLDEFNLDRIEFNSQAEDSKSEKQKKNKLYIQLEKILLKLPKNYEEVLRLRFLAGLKIREVAEILNKTENNIKVMQNRAIKKAQEYVEIDLNLKQ